MQIKGTLRVPLLSVSMVFAEKAKYIKYDQEYERITLIHC